MTWHLALAGEDLLLAAYLRRCNGEGISESTITNYTYYLSRFADSLAHPLDEATADDVHSFLAAERARVRHGKSGGDGTPTAAAAYKALSAFYIWADSADLLAGPSPMRGIRRPAETRKVTPVPATEDLTRLLALLAKDKTFAGRRDEAIIRLACELGGPRRAELAAVTIDDVDIRAGRVLVHGKGARDRWVPFGPKTTEALMRYFTARRRHYPSAASPCLWLADRGGHGLSGDGIRQMLARRCEQAGIAPMHPHQLRHWAGAQAKRNRVPTAAAMALFGWKTAAMYDQVYGAHADAEAAADLARQINIGNQL